MKIGDLVHYRNLNNDNIYYGKIVSINPKNGMLTVENSSKYQRFVDPKFITKVEHAM